MSSHSLICKRNNHFPRWKMLPVNSFLDDKKESEKLLISKCVEFVYFVICLLQQFKYLYDFIAISLLTRCMSINIFLSPTIQLCTNNRDCGLGIIFKCPKLNLRISPFYAHFFERSVTIWKFNLQYICYFYLNPLSEKCSNIWSLKLIGHLSKIEVQYYTQIVYVVLYWFLCSIDSGEILEPIIQFHASLILLSEIHLRLITISSPPTNNRSSKHL